MRDDMAFLLISAIDQKNRLKGDVITAKDDDVWGRMETLPNFVRVEVPLMTAAQLSHLLDDLMDAPDIDIQQTGQNKRLRVQRVNPSTGSVLELDALQFIADEPQFTEQSRTDNQIMVDSPRNVADNTLRRIVQDFHRDKVMTPLHRRWMLPTSIVDATIAAGGKGMATADAFVER
jgi:hypothetical protein